jgi:hypothetical protein
MQRSQVRGNQEANPVLCTAAYYAQRIAACPVHPALVVGRIADKDETACRRKFALAAFHAVEAVRLTATEAETIGRVVTDDRREADAPRGAVIELTHRARRSHPAGLGKSLLALAGASRTRQDAVKCVAALLGAPVTGTGLTDRIAGGYRAHHTGGHAGRRTDRARLWPKAGVGSAPGIPNAPGAPSAAGAPAAIRDAYKIRLRTSNGRHQQNGAPTREQISRQVFHGSVTRGTAL